MATGRWRLNAEAIRRGACVVSCDHLYRFSGKQVRDRIEATRDEILEQARRNRATFVWNDIRDVEELDRVRMEAMDVFLADYEAGRVQGRYVEAALPELPFPDGAFDLALCSHLFLYSDQLSESFHRQAVAELCRVAGEVRIFPLLSLAGTQSPHVPAVQEAAGQAGLATRIETVPYEFQRGGNRMMRVWRAAPSAAID
ncbi:MAG: methyltransferase domain-containing protein [Opitutaceae bacterium]